MEILKIHSCILLHLHHQHRLNFLKTRELLGPDPLTQKLVFVCFFFQCVRPSGLCRDIVRMVKPRHPRNGSFSRRLWVFSLIILPFSFHFLTFSQSRQLYSKGTLCRVPHENAAVASESGCPSRKGGWKLLCTVNDCPPMGCLRLLWLFMDSIVSKAGHSLA